MFKKGFIDGSSSLCFGNCLLDNHRNKAELRAKKKHLTTSRVFFLSNLKK